MRDFPDRVFLEHNLKRPAIAAFLIFFQRSVDGQHLMPFHSENSVFKFLRGSVGAWFIEAGSWDRLNSKETYGLPRQHIIIAAYKI